MKRREFMHAFGAAVTFWPIAARAEQPIVPVIGFLRSTPAAPFDHFVASFREGLNDEQFVEGRNVTIEYRWANNRLDELRALATELVRRKVAVIVGNKLAAEAAKNATSTIPIVFVSGEDPVKAGLVASLARPGANLTGVTFVGGAHAKRIELLLEVAPQASVVAVLLDSHTTLEGELTNMEAVARALGRQIVVVRVVSARGLGAAFNEIRAAGAAAVLVGGGPNMSSHRQELVALAARYALPAIYDMRDYVAAGGLISYAASVPSAYRQAGRYAGKILKGHKPADLPVLLPTNFELVINLKTARTLGLAVSEAMLGRADEVIE